MLLPWGEKDAITAPAEPFLHSIFKNVAPRLVIPGACHFIQEDAGDEVAHNIIRWMTLKWFRNATILVA